MFFSRRAETHSYSQYSVDKVTASACNTMKILESASREVLKGSFMMLENETHQIEKDACMRMKLM